MIITSMNELFRPTVEWIREDWQSNPLRFCAEVLAWAMSIGCSATMALTVPNPPLEYLYIPWVVSTVIYGCCAYTRRSFGMLANYALLALFDSTALVKFWI